MICRYTIEALLCAKPLAPIPSDTHIGVAQIMHSHTAQGHDDLGLDNFQLPLQPALRAKGRLGNIRRAVILRPTLNHVSGQHSISGHLGGPQSLIQKLTRGTYQGTAIIILHPARALPYENDGALGIAIPAHWGNGLLPKGAGLTGI